MKKSPKMFKQNNPRFKQCNGLLSDYTSPLITMLNTPQYVVSARGMSRFRLRQIPLSIPAGNPSTNSETEFYKSISCMSILTYERTLVVIITSHF